MNMNKNPTENRVLYDMHRMFMAVFFNEAKIK